MNSLLAWGILGIIICIIIGFSRGAYACLGAAITGFGWLMLMGFLTMLFPDITGIIEIILVITLIKGVIRFFRRF